MSPTEKWLAHANHWTFYVLLITMPIVGYLLASASGNPVYFFNAEIPALIEKNQLLQYSLRGLHFAGALVLIILMAVHVSAAMRHLWVRRDGVIQRMAPFLRR